MDYMSHQQKRKRMSNIKTGITSQNVNDVIKLLKKDDYLEEQKIKIAIAFGSALAKQNFKEETEYYQFVKDFEKYISNLV